MIASLQANLVELDRRAAAAGIAVQVGVDLARFTTLRVGGPADRFTEVHSRTELLAALRLAQASGVPVLMLGNGSDVVVADAGVRGLVIRNRAREVAVDGARIRAESGAPMALVVRRAAAAGLGGIEFGTSIPGTVGGAVWANAGAHGGDVASVLAAVEVWQPDTDAEVTLMAGDCAFGYRESRFKHTAEVILAAEFALVPTPPESIQAELAAFRAQRLATQPLNEQNAGSVFRNPPGDHAGRLIDAAGLKGLRHGTAEVSRLHANFIVTDRDGRASDVRALAEEVRRQVTDRDGIDLEFELDFVGAWEPNDG